MRAHVQDNLVAHCQQGEVTLPITMQHRTVNETSAFPYSLIESLQIVFKLLFPGE